MLGASGLTVSASARAGNGRRRGASQARSSAAAGGVRRLASLNGVEPIQRARILLSVADIATERGSGAFTVSDIVAHAGVSRRTFYELFDDREDSLNAAIDEGIERAAAVVVPAYREHAEWRESMRAGLSALLCFVDEEPAFSSLLVVGALGGGRPILMRRAKALEPVIDAVDRGRSLSSSPKRLSRSTAEGVVGAVLSILHGRMLARRRVSMQPLIGELMATIVMPYLGGAAAAREASRAQPISRSSSQVDSDVLRDLNVRLTYRTVTVLRAIADEPGASNRRVSELSSIADQGQASKLLSRLSKLDLVENVGGKSAGESNAWRLTAKGQRLARAIRGQERLA